MSFRITSSDGSEEGRDGHEAAGLIQSCHVECNPENVASFVFFYTVRGMCCRTGHGQQCWVEKHMQGK